MRSVLLLVLIVSCSEGPRLPPPRAPTLVAAAGPRPAPPPVPQEAIPESKYPGTSEGCPDGMLRVEGDYCPLAYQTCLESLPGKPPMVAERCLRYKEPSVCVSKQRTHMAFCMDRFEYPNKVGELPLILVDYARAVDICKTDGKRLCTDDEFSFACEGPEIRPYATGFVRDTEACSLDRPFRAPDHSFRLGQHDECFKDPRCAAEVARLDQRLRIGEKMGCVSWAGIYDMNGNVNEWVHRPGNKFPDRGGLKGGWWGPVRGRCRPLHTTHGESYWGYEVGLRCCKDVSP